MKSVFALDYFNQSAGALSGKTADLGGAWTVGGDGTDFSVSGSGLLLRTATSDSSGIGQYGYLGSALTDCTVSVDRIDLAVASVVSTAKLGVVARLQTGTGNCIAAVLTPTSVGGGVALAFSLGVYKRTAGTWSTVQTAASSGPDVSLTVRSDGTWRAWSESNPAELRGYDSDLATGGALASGRACIYDEWPSATAGTRGYTSFAVDALPTVAVAINPGRDLVWREDGTMETESIDGGYYAYSVGQQRSGQPRLGPGTNKLIIASATFSPDETGSSDPPVALDYVIEHRPAYQLGRHQA